MTTFGFATTRPLPSYLVAFAVGDFDVKPYAGASSVPLRLIATKGKAQLGDAALETAAVLVKRLAEYFDVSYPYEKLDLVAVPDFAAGAMENAGLITFVEESLLIDPKTASADEKRHVAITIGHELAHHWFGDLVTMQWWDDLWLNEGFATWMEAKIVEEYRPELRTRIVATQAAQHVMDIDALKSARAVRGPVRTSEDVNDSFDDITYEKAGAVLSMIESWVGPATFQKALRDYVRAYAWKNASAEDLLRALDLASNKDVTKVARSFLDRAGVPSLRVSLACEKQRASVQIKQSAWRPLGANDAADAKWVVPVCMRASGAKDATCILSSGEPTASDLESCPAWIYPNARQAGYFRFALDPSVVVALAKDNRKLEPTERLGFVSDAWAQVRSGDLAPDALLSVLTKFDDERDPYVTDAVVDALWGVRDALVGDRELAAFRAYVANRFRARALSLGWQPKGKPRGRDDETLLRERVLLAMGELAEDDATLREADAIAQKWTKDPESVNADIAALAVELGSRRAGEARFEALRAAARSAKSPEVRSTALHGLGAFGDAELLRRALDLMLTDEVRMHETWYVINSASAHVASRPVLWAWTKAHWDALRAKVPPPLAWTLVRGTTGTCTQAALDDAKSFFFPRAHDIEGLRRPVDTALDEAALCIALRERASPAVAAYFAKK
jgi:alanyl aminopeptidase